MGLLTKAFQVARKEGIQSLAKKSIIYVYERVIGSQFIGYFMAPLAKLLGDEMVSAIGSSWATLFNKMTPQLLYTIALARSQRTGSPQL